MFSDEIVLDKGAGFIINELERRGFEAYAVGGCVRDSLLGRKPSDWDITTNCLPEDVAGIFGDVIPTGLKHGTVTVLVGRSPYEVTTYRIDGAYSDGRRPDAVTFSRSLADDLMRRDFTVNAMAYNNKSGLVDLFGGANDLKNRIIRCVGEPEKRFGEDYLRILRAFRFAAELGFEIESTTASAAIALKHSLRASAAERVQKELSRIVLSAPAGDRELWEKTLRQFFTEFSEVILPELNACIGVPQNNPHHIYNVFEHSMAAFFAMRFCDLAARLAVLLHDTGKPPARTTDVSGIDHFYGHGKLSAALARTALTRLKYDNKTIDEVELLVREHDCVIDASPKRAKKLLGMMGGETLAKLLEIKRCDNLAQSPDYRSRQQEIDEFERCVQAVLSAGEAFSLKALRVNGGDLMAEFGLAPGPQLGVLLRSLLERVVDGELANEREELLKHAEIMLKEQPEKAGK